MPALFVGHGSPMNTLETNGYTEAWRAFGRQLPRPRAILVISAHWYFGATAVTAMANLGPSTTSTVPQELFDFEYPAPGAPDLAGEIAEVVKPHWMGLDQDQWGLDHGTWSVLAHIYPEADVPVVQLSINALRPLDYHLDLAARLAPLRDRGVMILASGNVVHNLGLVQWDQPDVAFDWAERFDDAVVEQLAREPGDILKLSNIPTFIWLCRPRSLHSAALPGRLGAAEGAPAEALVRGYAMGSISMTCYGLGAKGILASGARVRCAPAGRRSSRPDAICEARQLRAAV